MTLSASLRRGFRAGACALALVLTLVTPRGEASSPPDPASITRDDAISDLRFMIGTIVAVHPNAYFHESKHDLDALVAATIQGLPTSESRVTFFRQAARIVATLGDAHTSLSPYLSEIDTYQDAHGHLFPLTIRFRDDVPVVNVDLEEGTPVPIGAIVDEIDGRSMTSLVSDLGTYIPTETASLRRDFVAEDFREWLFLDGLRPPYRVRYHVPGGEPRTVSLEGATSDTISDWEDSSTGAAYVAPYRFKMLKDGIGDLVLHGFDDDDGKFDKFLSSAFRKLARSRARALVIDVRENDGGTTDVVTSVLDYLTAKPFRIMSLDRTKVSDITKHSLGRKKYVDLYDETAWKMKDGAIEDTEVDADDPDVVSNRFAGKVYVLEGPGTFSSAAIFAATVQDAKIGELLGEPSGGLASLYANGYDFKLPKSRLDVSASTEYFVRPSGDRSQRGVVPDRALAPTSELANDTELDRAVDLIETEIGSE